MLLDAQDDLSLKDVTFIEHQMARQPTRYQEDTYNVVLEKPNQDDEVLNQTISEEQSLKECKEYVQRHNIQQVLKDCIVQLCVRHPENPISILREYFQKLERVTASETLATERGMRADKAESTVEDLQLKLAAQILILQMILKIANLTADTYSYQVKVR